MGYETIDDVSIQKLNESNFDEKCNGYMSIKTESNTYTAIQVKRTTITVDVAKGILLNWLLLKDRGDVEEYIVFTEKDYKNTDSIFDINFDVFFDEIQNIDGWEKFVRRMADMKYRIDITGSNSKMLSNEIASTLGGRFVILNVYPYSFSEYLVANHNDKNYLNVISTKDRAEVLSLYHEYITYGAFPELVDIRNKRSFLNSIYQTVYLGDIITRNKITNDFAVRLILKKIAESVTKPLSFSRLTNILKNAGASLGKQTVINYVGYMTDSYLLFTLRNYAAKLIEKETSPKYYFMDTGLLGLMLLDCQSAQLENLVAIELVRRYGIENVYFFENNVEIDFYVPSEQLAIQVSMQILDNIDTKERETKAFTKLKNFIPDITCLLITNSEEAVLECNDIVIDVVPAWKWLLDAADTSSH